MILQTDQSLNNKNCLPTVSVVIPYYNREKYIDACLESVFLQNYPNMEIILVNDCSSRESRDYLDKYEHKIRILDLQRNGGASAARNLAIKQSQGEYIAFLDSDDLWESEKLLKQMKYFDHNPGVDGCHTGISTFNDMGIINTYLDKPKTLTKQDVLLSGHAMPSALVVMKSALMDVGLFDENIFNVDDHDLIIRIVMKNYRIDFIPEPLTKMCRENHGNLSSQFWPLAFNHIKLVIKHRKNFLKYIPDLPLRAHFSYFLYKDSRNAKRYLRPLIRLFARFIGFGVITQ